MAAYWSFSVVIVDFGSFWEAYEGDLSIIDHDVLELHVVIGVASLMDLLDDRKELAANMQYGV